MQKSRWRQEAGWHRSRLRHLAKWIFAMPAKLSVNLNAVAMLRNRRDLPWPSVEGIGRIALRAGASGLTVHPRPDQRHIRFSDLATIRNLIDDEFPQAEFNI